MVLLESISSDYEGRCTGYTPGGKFFPIEGVPIPKSIGVSRKEEIDLTIETLKFFAIFDDSKLYLIQNKEDTLKQAKEYDSDSFAIGYITFIR